MDRADSLTLSTDRESAGPRMSDAPPGSSDPQKPDRFEQERLKKLEAIEALGLDPWGHRFDGHIPIAAARAKAPAEAGITGDAVRVAGRLMLRNNKGKLKFFHLQDATGRIQLMVSKADVSEQQWKLIENLDLGDIIGADGTLRLTNTGEVTVFVKELTMLGKSLAQPPEKFHGARDTEMLLRQRYVDLIYSEGVLDRMLKRTKILESIRCTSSGCWSAASSGSTRWAASFATRGSTARTIPNSRCWSCTRRTATTKR
jgi:lysyl-tRNA synthetase class 2